MGKTGSVGTHVVNNVVNNLDHAVHNLKIVDSQGREHLTSFEEELTLQQRNVPQAYRLTEQVRKLSKKGIAALKTGDTGTVLKCYEESLAPMSELIQLRLPADFQWARSNEGGQEFVEFVVTTLNYPVLIDAKHQPLPFPSAYELYVTPQMYLAGVVDSVGELSRLAGKYLLRPENRYSLERRIEIRERFIDIAQNIFDYLDDNFSNFTAMIIDSSRRRGFRNTFRGSLDGIRFIITAHEDALNRIFDQHARLGGEY